MGDFFFIDFLMDFFFLMGDFFKMGDIPK